MNDSWYNPIADNSWGVQIGDGKECYGRPPFL